MNGPEYNNIFTKITYNQYSKYDIIKKYKIVNGINIGKEVTVIVKKDENGKKYYVKVKE